MEFFQMADIQFNSSQFICTFNAIPTTLPNVILSPTLGEIALEYHRALLKLNLENWLNFRGVASASCITRVSLFTPTAVTFLCPPDIDPVSVTPDQAQLVMLGDKVEWQCKTKASAAHTVHWMKVRSGSSSSSFPIMSIHGKAAGFQEQRTSGNVCQLRFLFFFLCYFFTFPD